MSISVISIRNFRSILSIKEKVCDLNIFVGQNDEGKSNILRALDLFFNHDKAQGYELVWTRDFCSFSPKREKKADEIIIELEINPPDSFSNRTPVVWKKIWRSTGLHKEELKHTDNSELSSKSKVAAFLKAMRFDYVPAIKGHNYFQSLMANLHDMLEATVEEQVRTASGAFTTTINDNTKMILQEIQERLGLETTIQLPPNLRTLFAQLEFTSVSGEKPFSLNQRGDGIKVRHIPIVLRWLAEQANHLSAPGRPKTVTIWGYEEPENNLELRRCFELAKEFVTGASDIQSFVTTHSPAFYSVFRESDPAKVALFLVTKDGSLPTTNTRPLRDADLISLDSSMGLLNLLEPHYKEAMKEIAQLRFAVKNLTDTNTPTIFCEGPSDRRILNESLHLFFPDVVKKLAVRCSPNHGGGHAWVGEMIIAWSYNRPKANAVGIFDKDDDAQRTMKKAVQMLNNPASGKKAFGVTLIPGAEIKVCLTRHIKVPFALEELYPADIWDFLENSGWLEERINPILLYNFAKTDITFNDYLKDILPEPHFLRLALKKVKMEHKESIAKYICKIASIDDRKRILEGFRPTLEECLKRLDVF